MRLSKCFVNSRRTSTLIFIHNYTICHIPVKSLKKRTCKDSGFDIIDLLWLLEKSSSFPLFRNF